MEKQTYPFKNVPLPYCARSLEPYIDAKTMVLHHDRHLQTYIDNLNKYLETKPELQTLTLEELVLQHSDDTEIKNNAGGVYNHDFFFKSLRPGSSQIVIGISGQLLQAFQRDFAGFDGFLAKFSSAASSVFGSGYAWLCIKPDCTLEIVTTANQDTPLTSGLCPLLCIDVWEHAYYLKHFNVRADYIKNFFNVVDWVRVSARLNECMRKFNCVG